MRLPIGGGGVVSIGTFGGILLLLLLGVLLLLFVLATAPAPALALAPEPPLSKFGFYNPSPGGHRRAVHRAVLGWTPLQWKQRFAGWLQC